MPRPPDAIVVHLTSGVRDLSAARWQRRILHAAPGRAVERIEETGGVFVLKWRDDREDDREALLYGELAPDVLTLLGAPRLLARGRWDQTHLLFLAWVAGHHADFGRAADVALTFEHLGRVHGHTARLLARSPAAVGTAAVRAEIGAPAAPDGRDLVLDPGDLRGENVLIRPDGGVTRIDYEGMGVRPRTDAFESCAALLPPALRGVGHTAYRRGYCQETAPAM